ncbi:MAG: hypothetical protein ACRD3N_17365 [Terracidiphilus sp.]
MLISWPTIFCVLLGLAFGGVVALYQARRAVETLRRIYYQRRVDEKKRRLEHQQSCAEAMRPIFAALEAKGDQCAEARSLNALAVEAAEADWLQWVEAQKSYLAAQRPRPRPWKWLLRMSGCPPPDPAAHDHDIGLLELLRLLFGYGPRPRAGEAPQADREARFTPEQKAAAAWLREQNERWRVRSQGTNQGH